MLVYWEIRSTNHTIQLLKKRDLIAWEMKHTKKVVIGVFLTLILTISSQSSTIPQYLDLPQNQQYITAANNASAEPEKGSDWANEVGMHFLINTNTGIFEMMAEYIPVGYNEDPGGFYSSQFQYIDIYDPNLNTNYSLGVEVSPNTLPCRIATSSVESKLFFFSTDDGSVYGNGWHWKEPIQSGGFIWNVSYTFFSPDNGWIASVNSYHQNGMIRFNTSLQTLNYTQSSLSMFSSSTNQLGYEQFGYELIRMQLLYHDSSITKVQSLCNIVNEANTFFRQKGIFIYIEELTDINPNNVLEANPENWDDPDEDCGQGTNLRGSIETHKANGPAAANGYFEHVDSVFYLYWDDGSSHDGLNWNVGTSYGCTTNPYWARTTANAGAMGVGDGWVRIKPNFPTNDSFVRHHSILFAHEVSHAMGADHTDAQQSWKGDFGSYERCGGDSTYDGVISNSNVASTELNYHSIMREGMPFDVVNCYGTPHFTSKSNRSWNQNGTISGLLYRHIQPFWADSSLRASEHGFELEYWFVQLNNEQVIDASATDSLFWRGAYAAVIRNSSSPLIGVNGTMVPCSPFFGIRTISGNNYLENYDAWQGRRLVFSCTSIQFENGNSNNFWPAPYFITGMEEYDGSVPPDDFSEHQTTSKLSLSVSGTWVIWPAYEQSVTTPQYGPWQWMALDWKQRN
jgi:hypothetical protein